MEQIEGVTDVARHKKESEARLKKIIQVVIGIAIAGAVVLLGNDNLVKPITPSPDSGIMADKDKGSHLSTSAQSSLNKASSAVEEGQIYRSVTDVAAYLHRYHELPPNYITKAKAKEAGWHGGDLWSVTDKKTIGGDHFGNYEATLPPGDYYEADVNYYGGKRGDDRLVYTKNGDIYYTEDHYDTFKKLY
ncbi:MAG: ribonuclease domain-containing protein [Aerococcus sp.]|nr:ribonuclease domain-containing protein [Aerococcus sp.]